jgi:hypothetical protein
MVTSTSHALDPWTQETLRARRRQRFRVEKARIMCDRFAQALKGI